MLTAPERKSSHCKCGIQMKYLVLGGCGPMGEHLAGNMEFVVKELGKAHTAITIIPCSQDAEAAGSSCKTALQCSCKESGQAV